MTKTLLRTLSSVLLLSLPLLAACESDEAGHDVNKNGVMHKAGLEDPLVNCTECHGPALRGGKGPDCYSCHSIPASHTDIRGGIAHDPGDRNTCTACHGPAFLGGLGTSCHDCHV